MFKSKYIVIDGDTPVVFTELLTHAQVARAVAPHKQVSGAGYCFIDGNQYVCYGESISLKVKSRAEVDSAVLNTFLGAERS